MTKEARDGTRGPPTRVQDLLARRHLDELLDEALEETFPASDSIAVDFGPSKSHHLPTMAVLPLLASTMDTAPRRQGGLRSRKVRLKGSRKAKAT
jgi:hypothetical protein